MNTASLQFVIFGALAACLYGLFRPVWWRQWALFVVNLAFLSTFTTSLRSFVPFLCFLGLGYAGAKAMEWPQTRKAFVAFLVVLLAVFVWLKKYTFLPASSFLAFSYFTVGLSYILFRVLHVLIDAHGGVLKERISPIAYLNYTLNFMTLVSGPIQRYEDFAEKQLAPVRAPLTILDVGEGLHRIAVGFFKVAVLSWLFSLLQKQALAALPGSPLWGSKALTGALIAALYPLYLYFNFSGYTDIVIGLARFFRFALPENFNRPFSAGSIIDLWNSWHMTLSGWLKSYVFNPLLLVSMRRVTSPVLEPFLAAPALFVTFFLIGVWHGQTSEFLFFGFLQGLSVSMNHLYRVLLQNRLGAQGYLAVSSHPLYMALSRGLTFAWFTFTLLWFWSNWKQLGEILGLLHASAVLTAFLAIFVAATILLSVYEAIRYLALSFSWEGRPLLYSRYSLTVIDSALTVVSLVVTILLNAPAPDIVYKAF